MGRGGVVFIIVTGVSNLWPVGRIWPRMAMNTAQHKIINLLKHDDFFSVFVSVCVFIVWHKTTLLPVWPRDAKTLDTPVTAF